MRIFLSRSNSRKKFLKGVTLVEFVILLVILGFFIVIAVAGMVDMPALRIDMAARKIQSDVRYAQSLAVSIQSRTGLLFRVAQDDYSVYREATPGNWVLVTNPLTKIDFTEQLNSGDFAGVDITIVYFNAFNRALVFDKWGNPFSYDIATAVASPLNNPAGVRLSTGAATKDVRVERGTGRVHIQ